MDRKTNSRPGRRTAGGARRRAMTWIALVCGGCVSPTLPLAPETPPAAKPAPAAAKPAAPAEGAEPSAKRAPRASTCVAFGEFNLKASANPDHTPVQREQLLDQARRAYQQALRTDPQCRDAYVGLIRVYERRGDHARAIETYHAATTAFPGDPAFRFDLGMCHARQKEWDAALDAMNAALAIDPENRTYGNMVAYTLARAGRYDESFAAFRRITDEAQAHYNLARMLHHLGDDAAARQHIASAVAADPNFAPARELLASLDAPSSAVHPAAATDAGQPAGR